MSKLSFILQKYRLVLKCNSVWKNSALSQSIFRWKKVTLDEITHHLNAADDFCLAIVTSKEIKSSNQYKPKWDNAHPIPNTFFVHLTFCEGDEAKFFHSSHTPQHTQKNSKCSQGHHWKGSRKVEKKAEIMHFAAKVIHFYLKLSLTKC